MSTRELESGWFDWPMTFCFGSFSCLLLANRYHKENISEVSISHAEKWQQILLLKDYWARLLRYGRTWWNYSTTSWGPGKHSMLPPGCRPLFLKPKCHKESKNGLKPINFRSPLQVIFSYYFFWYQKLSKKLDILLIFEILS